MSEHLINNIYSLSIKEVLDLLPKRDGVIVLIDRLLQEKYGTLIKYPQITVSSSEENKQLSSIKHIVQQLINHNIDRGGCLIVIGGGLLCDLGGFVASIYLRGIDVIYIPTTLLSQVDAAIGGKNGVNFDGYKNILGTIRQPIMTLFCTDFLKSLPKEEMRCGMAELLKTFLLADDISYHDCVRILSIFNARGMADIHLLLPFIQKAGEIKREIVSCDPYDMDRRRVLNLGHTFAHALEKERKISHGTAVSIGIMLSAKLSVRLGLLSNGEHLQIRHDFTLLDMPIKSDIEPVDLINTITKDKKKINNYINFILLKSIGEATIFPIPIKDLNELFDDLS